MTFSGYRTNISNCTEYLKYTGTLSPGYKEYVSSDWKNCSVTNSNTTFAINGGASKNEFKIAWISIWAQPVSCP